MLHEQFSAHYFKGKFPDPFCVSSEGNSVLPAGSSESGGVLQRQQPNDVPEPGCVLWAGPADAHPGVLAGRADGSRLRGPDGVRGRARRAKLRSQ